MPAAPKKPLNILFLGDVVGKPGRQAIEKFLPKLKKDLAIDFVVCNAENAAGGFGVTPQVCKELYDYGVDVITLGNHTWDKPETPAQLESDWRLLRPLNYPPNTPGRGYHVYPAGGGRQVAVVNLMGRLFMEPGLDCPFQASQKALDTLRMGGNCDAIIVDVHAETGSEKRCLAAIWDGKASLVTGSHTHIPTADTMVMPGGTGYQTDAGMCGTYDNSSLGMSLDVGVARFTKKGKHKLTTASGEGTMCGTFVKLNEKGLCDEIRPIRMGGILSQAS